MRSVAQDSLMTMTKLKAENSGYISLGAYLSDPLLFDAPNDLDIDKVKLFLTKFAKVLSARPDQFNYLNLSFAGKPLFYDTNPREYDSNKIRSSTLKDGKYIREEQTPKPIIDIESHTEKTLDTILATWYVNQEDLNFLFKQTPAAYFNLPTSKRLDDPNSNNYFANFFLPDLPQDDKEPKFWEGLSYTLRFWPRMLFNLGRVLLLPKAAALFEYPLMVNKFNHLVDLWADEAAEGDFSFKQFAYFVVHNFTSPIDTMRLNLYRLYHGEGETREEALYGLLFNVGSWLALSAAIGFGIKAIAGLGIFASVSTAITHAPAAIQAVASFATAAFEAMPMTFTFAMVTGYGLVKNAPAMVKESFYWLKSTLSSALGYEQEVKAEQEVEAEQEVQVGANQEKKIIDGTEKQITPTTQMYGFFAPTDEVSVEASSTSAIVDYTPISGYSSFLTAITAPREHPGCSDIPFNADTGEQVVSRLTYNNGIEVV